MADLLVAPPKQEFHYWDLPHTPVDVVVVPSLPTECEEDFWRVPGLQHKEERHLFTTLFLQNPHMRLFYFTSFPIDPAILQYYLSLIPAGTSQIAFDQSIINVREVVECRPNRTEIIELIPGRFYNICLWDESEASLAEKLAQRWQVVPEIKKLLRADASSDSFMLCYRTSKVEEKLASDLGLKLKASPAELDHMGSKSGSRLAFEESGMPFFPGTPLVHTVRDLAVEIHNLLERERGNIRTIVIKLDDFSAGGGNACLDLTPILGQNLDKTPSIDEIEQHLYSDHLDCPYDDQTPADFLRFVPEIGAIAEQWGDIKEGGRVTSPSVQCIVAENGQVKVISSHGQILEKHEYSGGSFPASTKEHQRLVRHTEKLGKVLAKKGVRGHFAVDFVELYDDITGKSEAYGIEINLRCTGTTAPYMALRMLCPGEYDASLGVYTNKEGKQKYYISTEGLKDDNLKGLKPSDFMALLDGHQNLKWNHKEQKGTLFHMLGAMDKFGKVGVTCIGDSAKDAERMMEQVKQTIAEMH